MGPRNGRGIACGRCTEKCPLAALFGGEDVEEIDDMTPRDRLPRTVFLMIVFGSRPGSEMATAPAEPDREPSGPTPGGGDHEWNPDKDPADPRRSEELVPA